MVSNAIAPASKKRPLPGGKKDDTSCVVAEVIEWTKEARLCPFLIPDLVNFCRGFAEAPVGSMLEKYGKILAGGLEHECYFSIYWVIPTDFHIFRRG